jgi:hypothetical protein
MFGGTLALSVHRVITQIIVSEVTSVVASVVVPVFVKIAALVIVVVLIVDMRAIGAVCIRVCNSKWQVRGTANFTSTNLALASEGPAEEYAALGGIPWNSNPGVRD